jgi:pimeloyl-ACP methyl ester carboxylesterase
MIDTFDAVLPHGITLRCRACGPVGAPLMVFLHGFPEAAFVWDELLEHFGAQRRCIAPNLRGYDGSSAPLDVNAYRARHLAADLDALLAQLGARDAGTPVDALVAHDWGGAVAWTFAAQQPQRMKRLVVVNSPHPATFLRELRDNPAQRQASAYMNFLCRPDAGRLLAEDDFRRLWAFFTGMGADDPSQPGGGWLTPALRERYREVWRAGLQGGCNYYRASPLRPPASPDDDALPRIEFAPEAVTVHCPTLVIWGERDTALPAALLDGLDAFVPRLRVARVPEATHWIVHEQPARVIAEIERELAGA